MKYPEILLQNIKLIFVFFICKTTISYSQCNAAWPTISGANKTISVNSRVATGTSLTGTLTVNAGVTLCTEGTATINVSTLTNNGTINHTGSGTFTTTEVINSGTITTSISGFSWISGLGFTNKAGASLNIKGNIVLDYTTSSFSNYGSILSAAGNITLTATTGATNNYATGSITTSAGNIFMDKMINSGSISSEGTITKLTTGSTYYITNQSTGTITAAGNINIEGTTDNYGTITSTNGTYTKTGTGEPFYNRPAARLTTSGNIRIEGPVSNAGFISSTAGTFTKISSSTSQEPYLNITGGRLSVFGNISIQGHIENCGLMEITNSGNFLKTTLTNPLTTTASAFINYPGSTVYIRGNAHIEGLIDNSGNIIITGQLLANLSTGSITRSITNQADGYIRICGEVFYTADITNYGKIEVLGRLYMGTVSNGNLYNRAGAILNITDNIDIISSLTNSGCITVGDSLWKRNSTGNIIISGGTIFTTNFVQDDGTLFGGASATERGYLLVSGISTTLNGVPLSGYLDICDASGAGAGAKYLDTESPAYAYPTTNVTDCGSIPVCAKATLTSCTAAIPFAKGACTPICAFAASVNKTDISCNGNTNGTATVAPMGTGPFAYSWSTVPAQNAATATGLSAGIYTVAISDTTCTWTTIVTITQPPALAINISSQTDVNCFGNTNGTATIAASGGTPNYTYSWSTLPGQTGQTVTGLSAGTYTLTLTDSQNCFAQQTITITQPSTPLTASIASQSNVACYGKESGTATVTPIGGTANYSYSWSTSPAQTNQTATGLSAGSYTVKVIDARNCSVQQMVTITQPVSALNASITSSIGVSCSGGNSGSATVSAGGGTPQYTYYWQPGGQTTATAGNLVAGNYTVNVTDQNGCSATTATIITQPPGILQANITNHKPVTCKGDQDGSASITATMGTPAYTYLWQPGGQTTVSITGLSRGTYTVFVTDSKGCNKNDTITIKESTVPFNANVSNNVPVICKGEGNGVIAITATGGTPAYTYQWIPNVGSGSIVTGLSGGTYTINVTDQYGCKQTLVDSVKESALPFSVTVSNSTPVTCKGAANGSISISATGGTPTYTYQWTPTGNTTNTSTGLSGGIYTVIVTDLYGCSRTIIKSVLESATLLNINGITKTPVTCTGAGNGSINISATGGTPAYTYQWSPGGNTVSSANNLSGGIYTITVTDQYGCSQSVIDTIKESNSLLAGSITSNTPVTCMGSGNGKAIYTPAGGTMPYTISWSSTPPQTGTTAINLPGGIYTVTVTDQYGCVITDKVDIKESTTPLTASSTSTLVSCKKTDDGKIVISVTGGIPDYIYQWSPDVSTTNIATVAVGSYTVTVRDTYGCSKVTTVVVNQLPKVNADFTSDPVTGTFPLTVNFTDESTGGTVYQWNFGDSLSNLIQDTLLNPMHLYKDSGTYVVRLITYNNWCADTAYKTIRVNMKSELCIPNIFTPDNDGKNDVWKLCGKGIPDLEVEIYDRWGLLIYHWDSPLGSWDGRTSTGQEVPDGTYYYIIKAKGTDGVDYGTKGGFIMLIRAH
ncbi:MAG: gliding motility-associated C-terminal domain-containing protein [Bacteroidetes bacterium]|nr:gliding motility-associated C-terminal domain-containing protein [Bacteroidota bacterium]